MRVRCVQAQAIGKAASGFIQEDLKMEYVYDYMFHMLNEYAGLLKFEPRIPEGAVELCSEIMACSSAYGLEKKFMLESLVKGPSVTSPCTMPPPYQPRVLGKFYRNNINIIRQVEKWGNISDSQIQYMVVFCQLYMQLASRGFFFFFHWELVTKIKILTVQIKQDAIKLGKNNFFNYTKNLNFLVIIFYNIYYK